VAFFGDKRRMICLDTTLGDMAHQQVGAAGVAESGDLAEQVGQRHGRILGPSLAQVLAVQVDEGGRVDRGADHGLVLGSAVVALDNVHPQV
jgi:hypothetical protein